MAAKQASTKRTSLMLGNDSDETQLVLTNFCSRRYELGFGGNVGLVRLITVMKRANGRVGLGACSDS